MSLLEESWAEREEVSYKRIFGDTGEGIYPIPNDVFERLNTKGIDPRWLTHGVFKCPPSSNRRTWAYVTSGMSNPWETEEIDDYSGLGIEFVLETENEEMWAIEALHSLMAYNLLLAAGLMGDFPLLDYGHRVPFALSSKIKAMMFSYPVNFPCEFSIKSGSVDLLQVVGITESELDFAKQTTSGELKEKIVNKFGGLVTDLERDSVI